MSFRIQFYTMYKAPIFLNIGFSAETSAEKYMDGQDGTQKYDYYIDKEFDINSFCKSVEILDLGIKHVRSADCCYF